MEIFRIYSLLEKGLGKIEYNNFESADGSRFFRSSVMARRGSEEHQKHGRNIFLRSPLILLLKDDLHACFYISYIQLRNVVP